MDRAIALDMRVSSIARSIPAAAGVLQTQGEEGVPRQGPQRAVQLQRLQLVSW